LLNEVEQLCTRIAVLSQGRKVFEGTIAEARSTKTWVQVQTDNFPRAIQLLSDAHLIVEHRDGNLIRLTPNTGTPDIVRKLVAAGLDVHAISVEEQTLESFYLELMKNASAARAPVISL
jgi:ABC-2 type transport system ATP-binding protein